MRPPCAPCIPISVKKGNRATFLTNMDKYGQMLYFEHSQMRKSGEKGIVVQNSFSLMLVGGMAKMWPQNGAPNRPQNVPAHNLWNQTGNKLWQTGPKRGPKMRHPTGYKVWHQMWPQIVPKQCHPHVGHGKKYLGGTILIHFFLFLSKMLFFFLGQPNSAFVWRAGRAVLRNFFHVFLENQTGGR